MRERRLRGREQVDVLKQVAVDEQEIGKRAGADTRNRAHTAHSLPKLGFDERREALALHLRSPNDAHAPRKSGARFSGNARRLSSAFAVL